MTIVNRRNAVLGWLAWNVGKRAARRKARSIVRADEPDGGQWTKPAVIGALATLGLGAWLARHYLAGEDGSPTDALE